MVQIHQSIYEEIRTVIGMKKPECGGVLGASPNEPISRFYFDHSGLSAPNAYTPDCETINSVLEAWAIEGIQMVGIIHSHENEGNFPSCGDLYYCEQILRNNPSLKEFLLPIVTLTPFSIHIYRVTQGLTVSKDELQIV